MLIAYDHRVTGDAHVLTPKKNLVGGQETVALAGAIAGFAATPPPKVVLDMHRISWVSSMGIEELRRMHRTCADGNGWMRLACVDTRIKDLILTSRLDWVFDTFDSIEGALAAPQHGPTP